MSLAASHIDKEIDYSEVHSVYQSMNCLEEKTEKEMDECRIQSLRFAKNKMDSLFKVILSASQKESQSHAHKTIKSQEDWKQYMESSCVMETLDSEGGSAYNTIINFCYETKVNERISYLQWTLSNP
jgi:uncharacterized protein YecT (DUF1311 family)